MNLDEKSGLIPGSMLPGYENRAVSSDPSARDVPADVFCYPRPKLWRDRVWAISQDVVTDDVKAAFVKNPPEYVVSDDLSWLDKIIEEVTEDYSDIKSLATDRLKAEFRAFRFFHATRTNDLASFYEKGLAIPKNAGIEDIARSFFLNGRFPHATEEKLHAAVKELNGGHFVYRCDERARAYCCADESAFTTRSGGSGHYLDFGSEYLYNIGTRLIGREKAQEALRAFGSPTIFIIDVPFESLESDTAKNFMGNVLEFLFCELVEGLEAHTLSPGAGSAASLRNPVPGAAFFGHFHPAKSYHTLK
jgi:hypothetical protein